MQATVLPDATAPALRHRLVDLHRQVLQYDKSFRESFARQEGYAFLAGAALLEAKQICPHGMFGKWCEANFPMLSNRTIHRYMDFSRGLVLKFPIVANLRNSLVSNGDISKSGQELMLRAVYEATDGKTITQLYRDLGVIRQPMPKAHHSPQDMTPEQRLDAERMAAVSFLHGLTAHLRQLMDEKDKTLMLVPDTAMREFREAITELSRHIKQRGRNL